jgi:hypothetical protein
MSDLEVKQPSRLTARMSANDTIFDDLDRLVLAGLALKSALLRTGLIRLYSREPHRRAALGTRWMDDFL